MIAPGSTTRETDVLIAGAGPTGLALGLWLTHLGIRFRIIDKASEPGTTSRALAVHARILEFYDQIGLAHEIVARGLKMTGARLWAGGRERGRVFFGDMGEGISPFPFALIFPQDEHERLLIEHLNELGVRVERPVTLSAFEGKYGPGGEGVWARLQHADGATEEVEARFLVGCDGAHSVVREGLKSGFAGGTYSHVFYVADVEARGPAMNDEINLGLDEAEFLAIFPLKSPVGEGGGEAARRGRFIGTIQRAAETEKDLAFDDVSHHLIDSLSLRVERVNWFSSYRVHHRVAGHFRAGSVFLAGDAAHIHSPVGGQGMNTGIGDAVNLAWKLAAVVKGRAGPALLESYEPERIAFARRLVATTDRAFQFILAEGAFARFARRRLTPWLLPKLFQLASVRRLMFRTISQTAIDYRGSPLATGWAGRLQPGDRLPWLRQPGGLETLGPEGPLADNFAPLKSLDWQIHVYGTPSPAARQAAAEAGLPLHCFEWSEGASRAGFERDAVYLIRPDGYIGLAATGDPGPALAAYRTRFVLDFADPVPHAIDAAIAGQAR